MVYDVECDTCKFKYIGRTKLKIKKRVKKHQKDVKKIDPKSELPRHSKNNFNHENNWHKPKMLDRESNYKKRLFLEMAFIHLNKNTMNNMRDTENLQYVYKETLNILTREQ